MKAVLVIDMPTRCSKCLFVEEWFNEYGEKYYYCPLHKVTVPKNGDACEKLKPLPQKMTMEKALKMERCGSIRDIYTTWDACLAEITGETE